MREEYDENLPETKILGIHWDPNKDTVTLKGYRCIIYVCTSKNGRKLLIAKTRVAPVGTLTLPKLELTATLLGVRLANYVKKSLPVGYTVGKIRYFSDSQVALSWITSEKNTWKLYVTNRVHEILENSKRDQWYYVNTENNPADIATRIDKIKEFIQGTMWQNGPFDLKIDRFIESEQEKKTTEEEKMISKKATFLIIYNDGFFEMVVARHSDWNKMIQTFSYLRRFYTRFKGEISVQEIKNTEDFIIRMSQRIYFRDEIENLERKEKIQNSSKIKKYEPFLDEQGFLKVGGRLKQSFLSEEEKHPKFLHPLSGVTKLLILKVLHGESTEVMFTLREKYWILRGRRAIRSSETNQFVLTPEHFLTGGMPKYLLRKPAERIKNKNLIRIERQRRRNLIEFWKYWKKAYLMQLRNFLETRGNQRESGIREGRVVLVEKVTCNPYFWPLARIVRVFPSADGIIRSAEVRLSDRTVLVRSVKRLRVLEAEEPT
uniref:DUF5641 domain-containing protein n=1 Tax=Strigamia maritima TaxID=126957 RepID=T1IX51_STRMM